MKKLFNFLVCFYWVVALFMLMMLMGSINSLDIAFDTKIKSGQGSRRDLLDDIYEKIIYLSKKDAQAIDKSKRCQAGA